MSFLFQFLQPGDPYYPNWVELRRRTLIAWLAFAAWIPVSLILALLLDTLFRLPGALVWAAGPLAVVVMCVQVYRTAWPCPRCGQPYYGSWFLRRYGLANRCLHCGLPEYAPHGDYEPSFPGGQAGGPNKHHS
jgi:hypothetical protein